MAHSNGKAFYSEGMELSPELYYQAYVSRDPRFDGVFYIGVTSTGIYCRPVCPARTPKASNCRFYDSAEAAEKDSFRPCLRCRPELSSQQIRRIVQKEAAGGGVLAAAYDTSALQISYRPPLRLEGHPEFPGQARGQKRRMGNRRILRAHRPAGAVYRLDTPDPCTWKECTHDGVYA